MGLAIVRFHLERLSMLLRQMQSFGMSQKDFLNEKGVIALPVDRQVPGHGPAAVSKKQTPGQLAVIRYMPFACMVAPAASVKALDG